jgi:glycosyltransferase involved in cell wall biosynthesis
MVSVVTIFYNAERFIQGAIESVFAQSYRDWELLLVDDGSTDRGGAIARRYAAEYPRRVRYLEHAGHMNRGMSASRNAGIRAARGSMIAFLDADDVWLPNKLQRQVELLAAHPEAAMIFGAPLYWSSWTGTFADLHLDHRPPPGVPPNRLYRPPTLTRRLYPLGSGGAPCPSDLLIRRCTLADVGLFEASFRGDLQLYEDQAFLAKMYLNAAVYVADECWTLYRQHQDSCVARVTRSGRYADVRRYFLNWLERYLVARGERRVAVWLALERALVLDRHPALVWISRFAKRSLRATGRRARRGVHRAIPEGLRRALRAARALSAEPSRRTVPPPGSVRFGDLRRVEPLSRQFGFDRGLPIDRYYIEQFLERYAADIRGHVLEASDDCYTRAYGGARVGTSDVLHADGTNPKATIVADLSRGDDLPGDTFDCIILTQTLHLIFDSASAVRTLYRILKPGGIVLATVPGLSQIGDDQWGESWFWGFTSMSAHRLFTEVFGPSLVLVNAFGNVLAATAFLQGLAAEELRRDELEHPDPAYQVLIGVRAIKPTVTCR